MSEAASIIEWLAAGADDAPAISAPDRIALTHGGLRRLISETAAQLHALGLGRGDRVAIVLPNGPEMATAFVAVAAAASTAPLNPSYRADELDFYLTDIGAKAILVAEDESGPAIAVAERLGIAVLRLAALRDAPAGSFAIEGEPIGPPAAPELAEDGDIALLLHTSGTTSRPKLVPLSHANLAASAAHIGATLGLTSDDRCLNIMPLFHIHGLIAAVLSSLAAGGSVFCTPGFNALRFFHWLGEARPSWYTAVPTMHQAILPRAARNAAASASALRAAR
ncbi:MAG: AMP-dependent synthetase, partial [Mesorhizobium sp.]